MILERGDVVSIRGTSDKTGAIVGIHDVKNLDYSVSIDGKIRVFNVESLQKINRFREGDEVIVSPFLGAIETFVGVTDEMVDKYCCQVVRIDEVLSGVTSTYGVGVYLIDADSHRFLWDDTMLEVAELTLPNDDESYEDIEFDDINSFLSEFKIR